MVTLMASNSIEKSTSGANPAPLTLTKVAEGPLVGFKVIFGIMVNEAEALFMPSLASTVYVPFGIEGTLNLVSKEPQLSVLGCGVGVTSSPSNVSVIRRLV